jgi:alpha-glucoside transport system substrate-binding protein
MSLQEDPTPMERVIDRFGRHRLLSFDRDPATRGPTVEVAHEALLDSWERLRIWIDDAHDDLRQHRRLAAAAGDWESLGRDSSLLLRGSRLEQLDAWKGSTDLALSRNETEYLAASLRQRDQERAEEQARAERERALERRSFKRLRALVAVLTIGALVAAGLTAVAVNRTREAELLRDEATVSGLTGAVLSNLQTDPELSLLLALHAVNTSLSIGEPVPAETVEALHLAFQANGIQYPGEAGGSAMIAGPAGRTGLYTVPLPELVKLARSNAARSLAPGECAQFFGSTECPVLPQRFPVRIPSEPVRPATRTSDASTLAGTEVTLGVFDPAGQGDLRDELDQFTELTGIDVRLVEAALVGRSPESVAAAGDPPDLAVTQPGSVASLGEAGLLMDLGSYVDVERLREDQSPYLVSLGTVGPDGSWPSEEGGMYGAFMSLAVKSLIWYPVPELRAGGYTIPETWPQLIDLSDRLVADGQTPWCLGWKSGGFDGWPGTDWIENLVLAEAGPEVYDRWTFHGIQFDSPPVREAFDRLGEILFTEDYLYHPPQGAPETFHDFAQYPMVQENPPACWLYRYPSFGAFFLPDGALEAETDVFPFPAIDDRYRGAMLGGGSMVAAFADRPEVRTLVQYFLGSQFGAEWAARGTEFISSNRRFDLENYPPFWRRQAEVLYAALAADTFRFDASDLMPPEIGEGLFWEAMMTYLQEGPGSLDRILAELDAAWPDDG